MTNRSTPETTGEGLKRVIGVWGLSANIINIVVGSGIFVLPALVSEGLGASGILAYLFCGFLITLIMLCFAEVGSKVTITGGAYAYVESAFGKYFGFLTTSFFILGSLMAAAAVANALVNTIAFVFPVFNDKTVRTAVLILIFSGLTVVNVLGVSKGISLVKLTTVLKLTPLLILIVWASPRISAENLALGQLPSFEGVGTVSLMLFFAFVGAEAGLSVGGEVRTPNKTVPRAILISFVIILILYVSLQVVAQGILGHDLADYKTAPLAEVARRTIGPFGVTLMIVGAGVSMFGYITGEILNMPRVLFRSAKDRVIPIKALSRVHPHYATPHVSIIVFTAIACVLSIAGQFKQLAILASASILLIYLGVALSVIKLRRRTPAPQSSFRIPGGAVVPVLSALTIFWLLTNLTREEMTGMVIALIVLSLVFALMSYHKRGPAKDL